MNCGRCGSTVHRDDAMNRRCDACEKLVRRCLCAPVAGPLPYVKPLKSSHECRVCRRWLEGEWARGTPGERVELERQMSVGRCDGCTREAALLK